jgi:hypothetical protein
MYFFSLFLLSQTLLVNRFGEIKYLYPFKKNNSYKKQQQSVYNSLSTTDTPED